MHNIKKAKRLPGIKGAKKYLGPYTVEEVKPSHLVGFLNVVHDKLDLLVKYHPVSTVC